MQIEGITKSADLTGVDRQVSHPVKLQGYALTALLCFVTLKRPFSV